MNKIFIFFVLSSFLFGKSPIWNTSENIVLKKDEVYSGVIYEGHLEKPLFFRWTLYKNHGLVVYLNYDKFPYQFILYQDYQRETFKLLLFGKNVANSFSYLYLSFKDFDEKNNTASLWLGVSGDAQFFHKN
ncbi:hypothetical protein [Helicobacter cappadocius]|uniref:Uncharacterized protein n=1 Tax=Helicobacter cappadocius TaxID=3063998 RepID=A0AA90T5J8_9HELI|nr:MULTISPECIES: hypothetical protein [unclassified Helicobacter]MDO7253585.1 hypothetical protein [Helicobacter sp. faydin-H75]MDP2539513.1 hypothetical protein [Helicobacter sp. faydin-H76]